MGQRPTRIDGDAGGAGAVDSTTCDASSTERWYLRSGRAGNRSLTFAAPVDAARSPRPLTIFHGSRGS